MLQTKSQRYLRAQLLLNSWTYPSVTKNLCEKYATWIAEVGKSLDPKLEAFLLTACLSGELWSYNQGTPKLGRDAQLTPDFSQLHKTNPSFMRDASKEWAAVNRYNQICDLNLAVLCITNMTLRSWRSFCLAISSWCFYAMLGLVGLWGTHDMIQCLLLCMLLVLRGFGGNILHWLATSWRQHLLPCSKLQSWILNLFLMFTDLSLFTQKNFFS